MRILLLAQFYPPVIGGEERHVRNLAAGLAAAGHDVHVGTLDVGGDPPDEHPGTTVHLLGSLGRRFPSFYPTADRPLSLPIPDPETTRALAALAARLRPDVVHAHNWIVNSWLPLPAAKKLPLVLSLHDYSHLCATKRMMFRDQLCDGPSVRKCLPCTTDHFGKGRGPAIYTGVQAGRPIRNRRVDVFAPVSRAVADLNQLDGSGLRWELVPNFVPDDIMDLPLLPRDAALPRDEYLFFAGDLSVQKGVRTLLAAHRQLGEGRPPLVLVGKNPSAIPESLPDDVLVFPGWEHARVLAGFQHALATALPSEWPDPCPTTVLEAMAMGTPLVTTHLGGIADMVVPDRSALVVEAGNVDGLTAALKRVIAEPDLRERLSTAAKAAVVPFLRSSVVERLETLYTELVDAGSGSAVSVTAGSAASGTEAHN